MPESGHGNPVDKRDSDEWRKESEEDETTIRESTLEGDSSSEYIQGAILEASEMEVENAESTEGSTSRLQLWLADNVTESEALGKALYRANPANYDRLDWIFAFGFVTVIASAVVMFQTTSTSVALGSLIVMFLGFAAMLMCVGIEDILKEGYHKVTAEEVKKEEGEPEESFEEGESLVE